MCRFFAGLLWKGSPIILALALLVSGCSVGFRGSSTSDEEQAPDFTLEDLDGQTVSLGDFRGEPVLLNFWATWCSPCRIEMPYLQQIYEEWSDRRLVLLTVNIGESPSTVKQFMQVNNLSLPVLLDTSKSVSRKYMISGIPTTIFIDKDGIIRGRVIGAFTSKEAIERYLREIVP